MPGIIPFGMFPVLPPLQKCCELSGNPCLNGNVFPATSRRLSRVLLRVRVRPPSRGISGDKVRKE